MATFATVQTPRSRRLRWIHRTVTGALIALLFLVPVLYVVLIAFETQAHFLRDPMSISGGFDAHNFSQAWSQAGLGIELINTALYSVVGAGVATVLALLIAFPISRKLVRHSGMLYSFLAIGLFLPFAVIPLFVEARMLGLWNNRIGYTILHIEPGMPLGVVLLVSSIAAVPVELDEAAFMDGASYLRYMWSVVVPMIRPGLFITFLYALLGVWNDIIGPVVLIADSNLYPITRGIYTFYGSNESEWTLLSAAIVVASLPLVALFAVTQRQLVRVASAGAVKS